MESTEQNAVYPVNQNHPHTTIEADATMPNDAHGGGTSCEGHGLPGVIDLTAEPGEDTRITQLRALSNTFRDMKQNSFLSSSTISNDLLEVLPLMMEGPVRRTDVLQSNLNYVEHALADAKATSREIEKAVIKELRRNEFLKIENSRLENALQDVMSAKRGSTAGSDDDEPRIVIFACLATASLLNSTSIANSSNHAISPIALQKWTGLNCTGYTYKYNDTLQYAVSATNQTYASFKIRRPLRGREQLDFSVKMGPVGCEIFLRSYWPRNSPVGCVNMETFTCHRIWLN
ncbi:hypothetical protein V493_03045 [Pseudogymnoascus sp. VKM F-4281 (FW-2241)]|nr:hypothetical protein V493_03045 [Pseudogymnoascus sp. VKM F-4281 (FW-2241)]